MARVELVEIPYKSRPVFEGFHERRQRWACIVAHRRAGKTVAAINDLIRAALRCKKPEPRFAYVAPFTSLKDSVDDIKVTFSRRFEAVEQTVRTLLMARSRRAAPAED
jgi:hypothetical protein